MEWKVSLSLSGGDKEPEAETVARARKNPEPKWPAIFSTDGYMFHQIAQETGTISFCERLWSYFSTVLRRCLETLGQFVDLGPESRECLETIATAFKHVTPLQGCET